MRFKILLILITSIISSALQAQVSPEASLAQADSLFSAEKYTQALEIYDNLHQEGYFSSAMLLKMSYIHEALGNYHKSSAYLLQHDKYSKSTFASKKINEIAAKNKWMGYEEGSFDLLFNWLSIYQVQLLLLILAIIFLNTLYLFYLKSKKKELKSNLILQLILFIILLVFNNWQMPDKAILAAKNNYLMTAPSSASDVALILGPGHQVKVLDAQSEIWVKIKLDDKLYFVRRENLLNI